MVARAYVWNRLIQARSRKAEKKGLVDQVFKATGANRYVERDGVVLRAVEFLAKRDGSSVRGVSVTADGKLVLSASSVGSDLVKTYVPGSWESTVASLARDLDGETVLVH